ncbi:epimerase [Streptomyces mashuensis]|uniref:Epimerase n=1 Tax=Streptomyces mashuensis TaxID=33904 RepID=A0A919EB55_9ACTN|nr:TIGR01777 family oxidoreductase [Streptomyces mashuensis]GHF32319.1 epimerase [Streptomyces mashuensis]
MTRVAVTGASGLIGSALVRSLRTDGHEVLTLVRRPPRTPAEVRWDPARQWVDAAGLAGCEAVVHLAGANIGGHRWTDAYKKELRDSRVHGTGALAEALASLAEPPRVLLSGSATGFYGDTGDREADEDAPPGRGFLAGLCVDWEEATGAAREAGIRTVLLRTGVVLSRRGGAVGKVLPLFRLGLGARLGNGRQYWSCIALRDHVAAVRHLMNSPDVSGPVNLTMPRPVTNREFTEALGRALRRPAPLAAPAPALRLALGEMAGELLVSNKVVPRRLRESGFTFAHPDLDSAVRAALTDA